MSQLTYPEALVVGAFQALAGVFATSVTRRRVTRAAGLTRGLTSADAARFTWHRVLAGGGSLPWLVLR